MNRPVSITRRPAPLSKKKHKGAPRRYWCPEVLDENGRLRRGEDLSSQCGTCVLNDEEFIPFCPHGLMVKTRFKRVEERHWEAQYKTQFHIGSGRNSVAVWADVAVRKAKCHICFSQIEKGERRIAFDMVPFYGATPAPSGGTIVRSRTYVHATCFIDLLMGGKAGEGCPGCSAKLLNNEFRDIKKLLEKRYGS